MEGKQLDSLVACHECDLLVERIQLDADQHAHCPRCNALLYLGKKDPIKRTLVVSISGLLMVYPAYFLPLMEMEALGISSRTSIINTVMPLVNDTYWIAALSLFLFAILFPVLLLALSFWIALHLMLKQYPPYLIPMQRVFQGLIDWGMPEVYVLGIIVSLVKLLDDFTVIIGTGLFSFCIMMFCSLLVTTTVSKQLFWDTLGRANVKY